MWRIRLLFLAVCLLYCATCSRAEDGTFLSNGVKIHFRILGHGEPVVLIHGFSDSLEDWNDLARALAKTHYVVTFDCRGHGKSDKPHDPKAYGVQMVEDVVRLMDQLRIPKAHVMGYSMGAIITAKLVALHPDRLLSATMGGGAGLRKSDPLLAVCARTAEELEKGDGITPIILYLNPKGKPAPTSSEIGEINKSILATNDPLALAAVMRGFREFVVSDEEMRRNRVPSEVIVGTEDPLYNLAKSWLGKMGGLVTLIRIEKADHLMAQTDPSYGAAFLRWLTVSVPQKKAPPAGEVALFDGKSFAGWEGDTAKTFHIQDGAIVGGSLAEQVPHNAFLCTTKAYGDFVLKLKFKLVGTGFVNGGVQIRSRRLQEPEFEMSGYQADMGEGYWASLYDESRRNKTLMKPDDETMKKALKPGDWNDYEIRCEGPRICIKLNGVQTVDYTEDDPTVPLQGLIGLQIHGGGKAEASYKDIRIAELPRSGGVR